MESWREGGEGRGGEGEGGGEGGRDGGACEIRDWGVGRG